MAEHYDHHVVPVKVYLGVFLALCVLTVTTVAVTGYDFGPFNLIVALGIAVTKATLVVLYFMHARYSPKLTGVVIASSIAFFAILVFLTADRLRQPPLAGLNLRRGGLRHPPLGPPARYAGVNPAPLAARCPWQGAPHPCPRP